MTTTTQTQLLDAIRSASDTQSLIAAQAAALTSGLDAAEVITAATARAQQLQSWAGVSIKGTKSNGIYCRAAGCGISCRSMSALVSFLGASSAICDVIRNAVEEGAAVDPPKTSKEKGPHVTVGDDIVAVGSGRTELLERIADM